MTFEDAQRAYDNLTPEDFDPPPVCPDCLSTRCHCDPPDED